MLTAIFIYSTCHTSHLVSYTSILLLPVFGILTKHKVIHIFILLLKSGNNLHLESTVLQMIKLFTCILMYLNIDFIYHPEFQIYT